MFRNLNKKGGVMSGSRSQQAKYQLYKRQILNNHIRNVKKYNNYLSRVNSPYRVSSAPNPSFKTKEYSIIDFPLEIFKNKTFHKVESPIKIDLAVPVYHGNNISKRKLMIIFFKYLRNISDVLAEYNIFLSFTIVGSDKEDSLNLFSTHLKKNELDTYIEYDQKNIDYKNLPRSYNNYKNPIFEMLHYKFYSCFANSWKKNVNINCLSGSNDFIDISFYFDAAHKYNSNVSQIYGLNKRKNVTLIESNSIIQHLNKDKTLFWNLDYGDNPSFKNLSFAGGIIGISHSPFWKKPENRKHLLDCLSKSKSAFNEVEIERIFIKDGDCKIVTIEGCYSINYKTGTDLTTQEMVIATIETKERHRYFDATSKNIIFTKCAEFWNKILSL